MMPEQEEKKGTKRPRPPWEETLMTDDELEYFKRGYLHEREMKKLSAHGGKRQHHGTGISAEAAPAEAAAGTTTSTLVGKRWYHDPDVSAEAAAGTTTTTSSRTKPKANYYTEKKES